MDNPNPGSQQAIDGGCICAVMDNEYGRGWMGQEGVFSMREDCPMHQADFQAIRDYEEDNNERS